MSITAAPHPESPLREALIEAGLALLIEGGAEGLTLRRAAARAGVSHAAPAHHFNGLSGLQTAIASRAFALFTEAMLRRREAAPDRPWPRLLAICEGYLDFAAERSGLFHIMFGCPDLDMLDADLARESARAYAVLRDTCLPFAGGQPDPVLEAQVWTSVHGYALLNFAAPGALLGTETPPPFATLLARIVPPEA